MASNSEIADGFEKAYKSKDGFYVQNSSDVGNTLYVRGTAKPTEWIQNILEGPLVPLTTNPFLKVSRLGSLLARKNFANKLDKVANENNVQQVYGHSRGDAVLSDMNFKGKKVGYDGATILRRPRTKYQNYRQNQWFDKLISLGGRNNITIEQARPGIGDPSFHKVYLSNR